LEPSPKKDKLSIARDFIAAIERQAWAELAASLDPAVHFRALTPKGFREAEDREAATKYLQKWFGAADQLVVQSSDVTMMHDRVHIAYRIREHEDQWYIVEQQAYCTILDGQIATMNLLCSGFRPEVAEPPR
jgi:hypothetical protein